MIKNHVRQLSLLLFIIIFFPSNTAAKSLHSKVIDIKNLPVVSVADIAALENRLIRFFRNRQFPTSRTKSNTIVESDLLQLNKVWNVLSDDFKSFYDSATAIPDTFDVFNSPGGHFSIYYTTDGWSAVDPTDTYHYSDEDWQTRIYEPNGVPDYIDETAFGFDSAWVMEVERFGFAEPVVYKAPFDSSDRYKVVVEALEDGYYGFTYPHGPAPGRNRGHISSISIRNDWSGSEWKDLGYDKYPFKGQYVTCAHEFFHAIQYAMSWSVISNTLLDDFPIGWIEGTAVAMEELAFPSINDYHQYSQSYFVDSDMSFFGGNEIYSNSILVLYLFKHAVSGGGIDFIYNMHFNNYEEPVSFSENLFHSAMQCGTTWADLLHQFHVASYYTGERADTAKFIDDANDFHLSEHGESNAADTLYSQMQPNSAKSFKLMQDPYQIDTVTLLLAALEKDFTTKHEEITTSVLFRTASEDTVVPLHYDSSSGSSSIRYTQWKKWDDMIIIATNSNPDEETVISFFMQPYAVRFKKDTTATLVVTDTGSHVSGTLRIVANKDIRIAPDAPLISVLTTTAEDTTASFYPITKRFSVSVSEYITDNADLSLTLELTRGTMLPSDTIYLGYRSDDQTDWDTLGSDIVSSTTPSLSFYNDISKSGDYLFVYLKRTGGETFTSPLVFPNPFSIKKHGDFITFRGRDITEINVYTLTGNLIRKLRDDELSDYGSAAERSYSWNGKSRSGKRVAPGTYPVIIIQDNSVDPKKYSRHKLVVTP